MCRIALCCLVASIGFSSVLSGSPSNADEIDVDGIFSIYRDSSGSPEFIGTGFYIGDGIAVSAAHVFFDTGVSRLPSLSDEFTFVAGKNFNQSARFAPTGLYECGLHFDDLSHRRDVCFVQLDGQIPDSVTEYKLSCPDFLAQPELVVAGYYKADGNVQTLLPTPTSVQAIIHGTTYVEDLDVEITNGYIQTPFEPQGGLSGSPIFDTLGQVVGVHSGEVDTQWFAPFSGFRSLTLAASGKSVFDSDLCRETLEESVLATNNEEDGWADSEITIQGVTDWVIDLQLVLLGYSEGEVSVRVLEVRSNNSNKPVSVLNRIRVTELFNEPRKVQTEVRTISSTEMPENLGLMDFVTFEDQSIETKVAVLSSYYDDMQRSAGTRWGRYVYDATTSQPTEQGQRVAGTVTKNTLRDFWSVNYDFDNLETPLEPGDSLIIFTEYTYSIDDVDYFSEFDPEQWGATPRLPMRNSLYTFDASSVPYAIAQNSFRSFASDITGSGSELDYKIISDHSDQVAIVYHKNLPSSVGVKIEFYWEAP